MVCVISSALKSAGGMLVSTSGFSFMMIIFFLLFKGWEVCRVVLSLVGIIDECFKVLCFENGWMLRDRVFVVVGSVCEHLAKCVANTVVKDICGMKSCRKIVVYPLWIGSAIIFVQVRIFVHMCNVAFDVSGHCAKSVVVVWAMCMGRMAECAGMRKF